MPSLHEVCSCLCISGLFYNTLTKSIEKYIQGQYDEEVTFSGALDHVECALCGLNDAFRIYYPDEPQAEQQKAQIAAAWASSGAVGTQSYSNSTTDSWPWGSSSWSKESYQSQRTWIRYKFYCFCVEYIFKVQGKGVDFRSGQNTLSRSRP